MTTSNRTNKNTAAVLCAGLIGATSSPLAPAAEARSYEVERRMELRQLRRDIRRDMRDYRCALPKYRPEVYRYPSVIPAYRYDRVCLQAICRLWY